MAYLPPHLRKQSTGDSPAELPPAHHDRPEGSLTLAEIENYFWPAKKNTENDELCRSSPMSKTLHGSAETPNELVFIILFWNANPRWDSDYIIFTKTHLELLPKDLEFKPEEDVSTGADAEAKTETNLDGTEGDSNPDSNDANGNDTAPVTQKSRDPVAVFKELPSRKGGYGSKAFHFAGWYKVDKLQFLEPQSPELVRMLEQKWSRTNSAGQVYTKKRDSAGWNESLRHRWAVIKLDKDEVAGKERGTPEIEKLPDSHSRGPKKVSQKSVNEQLAEMRLQDGKHDGETNGEAVEAET